MTTWWIDVNNPNIIGTGDGPTEYVGYFFDADDAKATVELLERVTQLEAENERLEEYAKEGWAWVDEFCTLSGKDVFALRDALKESNND